MTRLPTVAVLPVVALLIAGAETPPAPEFGPQLERFAYPWPVQTMPVDVIGAPAQMAFMDIQPERPNGRAVVLLHGKNFCGATWEAQVRALVGVGYRVLVPD
ncbi:MAG: alpha/beta fold hydrolase, partial [Janthinobacterium lividum]